MEEDALSEVESVENWFDVFTLQ